MSTKAGQLHSALSNEALASLAGDYWTIGSTTVAIVCIAATATACTSAVMVVAGGNIALSLEDNILEPMDEGRDACFGLFLTEFATNTVGGVAAPAATKELSRFTDIVVITNGTSSFAQYVVSVPSCD